MEEGQNVLMVETLPVLHVMMKPNQNVLMEQLSHLVRMETSQCVQTGRY